MKISCLTLLNEVEAFKENFVFLKRLQNGGRGIFNTSFHTFNFTEIVEDS
jgi:hypothetical protein